MAPWGQGVGAGKLVQGYQLLHNRPARVRLILAKVQYTE